ncbi:hypothetical protein CJF31_00010417 [Rutstroemia sp. NJR-2017a BVV2]|nr:hypothetical protein CJF31_00010417 [Rutstroemia sp. NJR-2017a BVV2]
MEDGESREWTDEESIPDAENEEDHDNNEGSLAQNTERPLWLVFAAMAQQVVTNQPELFGHHAHTRPTSQSTVKDSEGQSHAEQSTSTSAATGSANNATANSLLAPVSSEDNSASVEGHAEWLDTESEGDADDGDSFTQFVHGEEWRRLAMNMGFRLGDETGEMATDAFQTVLAAMGIYSGRQISNLLNGIIAIINTETHPTQPSETPENVQDESNEGESHEVGMRGGFAGETGSTLSESDEQWSMYPEILRVNKQIYDEASSLLYTEGTVVIDAYDMFCLNTKPSPERVRFGAVDENVAWRHNPLEDPGTVAEDGTVTYSTPEFGGLMEPHVFARFQKVLFDATFDEVHMQDLEFWLDLDTGKLADTDVSSFQRRLRRSPIVKDLVKLLSLFPIINKLTINLLLEVRSASRLDEVETESEEDEDAESEEGKLSMEEKIEAADLLANQRATEALMDTKFWRPLKQLSNVRTFEFRYGCADYEPPVEYAPPKRHVQMIEGMKKAVEANFGKQGAKREKRRGGGWGGDVKKATRA